MVPKINGRISHSESQHDECHIIVLRRASGKGVGRTKQALQQRLGVQVRVHLRLGDHSVFAPLVLRIEGLPVNQNLCALQESSR